MTNEQFQSYVLTKLDLIAEEVTLLKGKSIVWGAVGGLVSTLCIGLLVALFSHLMKG